MLEVADVLRNFFLLFGFLLECLLLYSILTQTPQTMKNIQGYFFMISLSEALILTYLGVILVPEGVRGLPGFTLNGLCKYTGNMAGIIMATAASSLFSIPLLCILLCSLIRLLTICGIEIDKYTPLFIFTIIGGICGPVLVIPMAYPYFFLSNEKLMRVAAERNLTQILDDLVSERRPYVVFDTSSKLLIPAGGLFILACGSGAVATICINMATYIRSKRLMETSSISASKHDIQRRLMFILVSQISAPIVSGVIAFAVCIPLIHDYFRTNMFELLKITDVLYCLAAADTIFSAGITLIVIRPYRSFVMNLFKKTQGSNSVDISNDSL